MLATGKQIHYQAQDHADNYAGDNRKIKRDFLATIKNISGQTEAGDREF